MAADASPLASISLQPRQPTQPLFSLARWEDHAAAHHLWIEHQPVLAVRRAFSAREVVQLASRQRASPPSPSPPSPLPLQGRPAAGDRLPVQQRARNRHHGRPVRPRHRRGGHAHQVRSGTRPWHAKQKAPAAKAPARRRWARGCVRAQRSNRFFLTRALTLPRGPTGQGRLLPVPPAHGDEKASPAALQGPPGHRPRQPAGLRRLPAMLSRDVRSESRPGCRSRCAR